MPIIPEPEEPPAHLAEANNEVRTPGWAGSCYTAQRAPSEASRSAERAGCVYTAQLRLGSNVKRPVN